MLKNGGVAGRASSVKRERKRGGLGALRESECSKNGCGKEDACKKGNFGGAGKNKIRREENAERSMCRDREGGGRRDERVIVSVKPDIPKTARGVGFREGAEGLGRRGRGSLARGGREARERKNKTELEAPFGWGYPYRLRPRPDRAPKGSAQRAVRCFPLCRLRALSPKAGSAETTCGDPSA